MKLENIKEEVVKNLKNNLHVILETSSKEENGQDLTSEISKKLDSKPMIVELSDYNPLRYVSTTQSGLSEPTSNEKIENSFKENIKNLEEHFKTNVKVLILESTPGNDLTPYLNVAKENNYSVLVLVNQGIDNNKLTTFEKLDSLKEEFAKYPTSENFKNDAANRIKYMHGTDSSLSSTPKRKM